MLFYIYTALLTTKYDFSVIAITFILYLALPELGDVSFNCKNTGIGADDIQRLRVDPVTDAMMDILGRDNITIDGIAGPNFDSTNLQLMAMK